MLEFKPKEEQVRIIYSDQPQPMFDPEDLGKVFAVIGPIGNFTDKKKLQDALRMLLRGWNIRSDSER